MADVSFPEIPPACLEVVMHTWDFLDGQLTAATAASLTAHIEACQQCRDFQLFEESFLEAMARLRRTLHAPAGLRERLLVALHEEGFAAR
jgi:anti-sigma factor (TIGR02949 family)